MTLEVQGIGTTGMENQGRAVLYGSGRRGLEFKSSVQLALVLLLTGWLGSKSLNSVKEQ